MKKINLAVVGPSDSVALISETAHEREHILNVITEENLSQAYKVPLRLYKNPVTGGIEITTQITATTQHQKNSLLKKICCQVC